MIRLLHTIACGLLLTGPLLGEEFRPWQSLGEDTVFCVSVSHHAEVSEAFSATALGAITNPTQLVQRLEDHLRQHHPDDFQEMTAGMNMIGVSLQDLVTLFSGPYGAAAKMRPSADGEDPDFNVLVWLTPGAELNQRLLRVLDIAMAMQEGPEEQRATRWDHQVAGHTVIELRGPAMQPSFFYDDNRNFQQVMVPAEDDPTFLIAMDGDRLIISVQPRREDSRIDQERLVNFVQASAEQTVRAFGSRILESPGLSTQLALDGPIQWEAYGDISRILSLIPSDDGPHFGPSPQDIMKALSLDHLGLVGLRGTVLPNRLQANLFVEAPSPRPNLLAILDQDPLTPRMPAWMQASVLDGQIVRLDLVKVYQGLVATAIAMMPEAEQGFHMANQQMTALLNADIPTILAAFGDIHELATYPLSDEEIAASEKAFDDDDFFDIDPMAQVRLAWVMQLRNPELINNIINVLAPMSGLEITEQQGYRGLDFNQPMMGFNAQLFFGNDQFIMTMGEGVAERVLNLLRNPPPSADQLANHQTFLDMQATLPQRPIISLSYSNTAQNLRQSMGLWKTMSADILDEMVFGFGIHFDEEMHALSNNVFPDSETLAKAFGIAVQQLFVNDQGLGATLLLELPAKE